MEEITYFRDLEASPDKNVEILKVRSYIKNHESWVILPFEPIGFTYSKCTIIETSQ